ncbi:MAG: ATP-dependent DNA helicase RecG [Ruminococcus sp.]|jgi:ATP-dependent DNA helicase RecG|nr:ATP-dependent DNA helicase RecG [Ruminococcus sp.]
MNILSEKISRLTGVGAKKAELYEKVGVFTMADILNYTPRDYISFAQYETLENAPIEANVTLKLTVTKIGTPARIRTGLNIAKMHAEDETAACDIVFFNTPFMLKNFSVGKDYFFRGKLKAGYGSYELHNPKFVAADADKLIIPVYPLTAGLTQDFVRNNIKQALKFLPKDCEILPQNILDEFELCGLYEAFQTVHYPDSLTDADTARKRLSFDELLLLRVGMKLAKNKTAAKTAVKMTYQPQFMAAYEANLPFALTSAQHRAIAEITDDMRGDKPMNRLLQGDVGSGKTAVAAAAMAFSFANGRQSALMAPTEILAAQHFRTLEKLLSPLGVKTALLTGSLSAKQKTAIREGIAAGVYQAAVGTHALIADATEFCDLGLIITDEQHRFGVSQRAKLSAKGGLSAHRLVMSATPIPRTLGLIIYGDLDISVLDEMPAGRIPIETFAVTSKLRGRAYGFVQKEIDAGHQIYAVCPAIGENDSENINEEGEIEKSDPFGLTAVTDYAKRLADFFKNAEIAVLHGKMDGKTKDGVMADFTAGKTDILVSTTVIEVGVDVPNATVMLIEDADRFGLSQIHQLRGRVGRGGAKSYCILITSNPTPQIKERLAYLAKTADGFAVAEYDLKTRGAGDFLGSRQHGLPKLKTAAANPDNALIEKAEKAANELFYASPDLSEFPKIKETAERLMESAEMS